MVLCGETALSNTACMSAWFCWTASECRGCRGLACAVAASLDSGSRLVSSTTLGTHGLGLVGSIPEHLMETLVFDYKSLVNPKLSAVPTSIVGCSPQTSVVLVLCCDDSVSDYLPCSSRRPGQATHPSCCACAESPASPRQTSATHKTTLKLLLSSSVKVHRPDRVQLVP